MRSLALRDRVFRDVGNYEYSKSTFDGYDLWFSYGDGSRAAGDGSTLLYSTFSGTGPDWEKDVWRVVGRSARRVPYQPADLVADLAASGGRFATLGWQEACACDRFPVYAPDGKEVAWSHDGAVWVASPDGAKQRRISSGASASTLAAPRWSPSGASVAYEAGGSIYVIGRDGRGERKVATGQRPSWSPDGTRLVFTDGHDLWVVNADGTGLRRLTSDGVETTSRPDWSPDGTTIAVARAGDLYLVDALTGGSKDLLPDTAHTDGDPVWSPNGKQLAFVRGNPLANVQYPYQSAIDVVDRDGSNVREVARHNTAFHVELFPSWSPDGGRLSFVYDDQFDALALILVVNVDGSGLRTVSDQAQLGAPSWSPDGKRVVYGDALTGPSRERGGIFTAATTTTNPETMRVFPADAAPLEVRDALTGKRVRRWTVPTSRSSRGFVAFSGRYVVVTAPNGVALWPFDVTSGKRLPTRSVSATRTSSRLSLSGRLGVYRADGRIVLVDVTTGGTATLAHVPRSGEAAVAGPVIEGSRVLWAEPAGAGSRVREIRLG